MVLIISLIFLLYISTSFKVNLVTDDAGKSSLVQQVVLNESK